MQVIDVTVMHKRYMSTLGSVDMGMLIVNGMTHQNAPLAEMNDVCSLLIDV